MARALSALPHPAARSRITAGPRAVPGSLDKKSGLVFETPGMCLRDISNPVKNSARRHSRGDLSDSSLVSK